MKNQITTPKGTAKYPHIKEPNTRFNPMGEFSCNIVVSEEDGIAFKEKLQAIYDEAYERECFIQKGKKLKKASTFPVAQDEDGDWVIKTKQPAKVETKDGKVYEFNVKCFDASGSPCDVNVGSGSTVRVSAEPRTWYVATLGFGVTLSLKAVQVIDLIEQGGGGSADSFGFGKEEGFVGESLEEAVTSEDNFEF